MSAIEVIDNFLPDSDFFVLSTTMLSPNFPWFLQDKVANQEEKYDATHCLFTHILHANHSPRSDFFGIFVPALDRLKPRALIRAKVNLYPRTETKVLHGWHVDNPFEHRGAILHLNTNNGVTILEDGTEVESVANRMVIFNSAKPHRSTTCTDEKVRANININFL